MPAASKTAGNQDPMLTCSGKGNPATPYHGNPGTPAAIAGKSVRRRKAGRYAVKKSVLFERSEFTDFRNTVRLFSFWRLRA